MQASWPFDDLDGQFEVAGCPGLQLPGIPAVGPGPADAVPRPVQVEQQRPGRVAVLHRWGGTPLCHAAIRVWRRRKQFGSFRLLASAAAQRTQDVPRLPLAGICTATMGERGPL